jgi:hypothetical protein
MFSSLYDRLCALTVFVGHGDQCELDSGCYSTAATSSTLCKLTKHCIRVASPGRVQSSSFGHGFSGAARDCGRPARGRCSAPETSSLQRMASC